MPRSRQLRRRRQDRRDAPRSWLSRSVGTVGGKVVAVVMAAVVTLATGVAAYYTGLIRPGIDSLLGIEPIDVSWTWPLVTGCAADQAVAMPHGGPDVRQVPYPLTQDSRVSVIDNGGASWVIGRIGVVVSAKEGRSAFVDVDLQVFGRDPAPLLDWTLYQEQGGCGGSGAEYLRYDLDRSTLEKVRPDGSAHDESSPQGPDLHGVRVTPDQPLRLNLTITSCHALYRWGLRVSANGRTTMIGTLDDPLVSAGGVKGIPRWAIGPSADGGRRLRTLPDATDGKCGAQAVPDGR